MHFRRAASGFSPSATTDSFSFCILYVWLFDSVAILIVDVITLKKRYQRNWFAMNLETLQRGLVVALVFVSLGTLHAA